MIVWYIASLSFETIPVSKSTLSCFVEKFRDARDVQRRKGRIAPPLLTVNFIMVSKFLFPRSKIFDFCGLWRTVNLYAVPVYPKQW